MNLCQATKSRKFFKRSLAALLAVGALLGLAVPAGAVLSGENGRIAMVSGRTSGDATALIHFLPVPFSSGGGTLSAPITPPGGQYRHPTWSPDRTMIAYANGTADNNPVTQNFDIYVQDVASGGSPIPITNTGDSLSADRPAWSPDGTKIAYEHQPVDASAERDIRVQSATDLTPPFTALDLTSGAPFEGKPAWTPNSQTIYYAKVDGADLDIVREPAVGGTVDGVLGAPNIDEYQPSISPDGTKMCFTRQSTAGNLGTADVLVAAIPNPGSLVPIVADAVSEYNCTWSPDGQKIAYVSGAFGTGALEMRDSNGLGSGPDTLAQDPAANTFDGNPDWAPDGRPDCPDSTVSTTVNTPLTIELECTDTGPAYEQTDANGFVSNDGAPANGTTSDSMPLANPSTVVYTPDQDFTGTDSLEFGSFDTFGFGVDTGTVTINVNPNPADPGPDPDPNAPAAKCGGRDATIVGTTGKDTLVGTNKRDVIAGLRGNDIIRSGRGNDFVCGGLGKDRLTGGRGKDSLLGQGGNDRLLGGAGRDKLKGGAGKDRLNGGAGRDGCNGGAGLDRGNGCEQFSKIP